MADSIYNKAIKLPADEAYEVSRRLNAYENSDYINYRKKSIENRDFHFGIQYSDAEIEAIEGRGQYAIAINRLRKANNTLVGMLTSNRPEYMAVPANEDDKAMAQTACSILKYCWHKAKGLPKWRKAVMQGIRDNIGWILVEKGLDGEVAYKNIPMEYVIPDPASTDQMYKDAEYIYYVKWVSTDQIEQVYGISKDDLQLSIPEQWSQLRTVAGNDFNINPVVSEHKDHVKVHEGYHRIVEREFKDGVWTGKTRVRIEKETVIGYDIVFREQLPEELKYIPLVPVYAEDTESAYKLGETNFLVTLQRLLNKCFGIMLLNAQLASNPKVFVWSDTIPDDDIDAFEANYAAPGSINVIEGNGKDGKAPIIVNGLPINNAWYTMVQLIFNLFEYNTLPNQMSGYQDSSEKQSAMSVMQHRESILDSYRTLVGILDQALAHLGDITLQLFKAYHTDEEVLRIVDGGKVIERVNINMQQGLNVEDERSIEMYRMQQLDARIDMSLIEKNIAKAKTDLQFAKSLHILINDTKALDVDLFVVTGSYAPSYKTAKFQIKKELLALDVVDRESVLDDAPIDNVEEIKARVSETNRLRGQVMSLKVEMDKMQVMIEQYQNAAIQAQQNTVKTKFEGKMEKDYTSARGKNSKSVALHNQKLNFKMSEINRIVESLKKLEEEAKQGKDVSLSLEDILQ